MNRILLVVVCIAQAVVGNVDSADNCDCQCEAVDKPCRCVCDIKNGGEPFYQRPPQDVIDGWNRETGKFFEKTKRTVEVSLTEDELVEANARDRERRNRGPWPATRTAALLATAATLVAGLVVWLLRPLYAPPPPRKSPRPRKNAARRRRRAVSTETRREGRSPRTPSDPARLRRLARRARPRSSRSRVAFSDADLASAADADAAAALASHAPADAAAPAAGLERESCDTTQGDTDIDVASQLSRLSLAGAEAEPRSPRSPRTPKDACVVCWERRREVACYPCMCVAASRRFPLILHLTPRLRGDTPSPRRRLNV
jgi:hypothetical protein